MTVVGDQLNRMFNEWADKEQAPRLSGNYWTGGDIVADVKALAQRIEEDAAKPPRPVEHLMQPGRPGHMDFCWTCNMHVDKRHQPLRLVKKPWK